MINRKFLYLDLGALHNQPASYSGASHTASSLAWNLGQPPGAEAAWDAKIAERIARFDSGEAQPILAAAVFERLHQIAQEP